MLLNDEIFDENKPKTGEQEHQGSNQNPVNNVPGAHNEELEKQRDYQRDQSNNKDSNDASAARNTGANAYTQRSDQKDQLSNLHIGGSETEPQGGNNHATAGEQAQGPGFTEEGSYELGDGIRMHDQRLGEDHTSGPARKPQDETSN
ncbi:hypothetical protein HHL22_04815 [Hymenobacter sp. RP-2-7]|uniref:Uncharacterized protein n=1 Tax=Hymenobacter polaris TaxID=2682546 RepID=A0A7Y0ACG3_9BACT|nr:hypothetical protein [Hymenobacter polaris]NML64520.1 hypothetical protein [Hymenobacter polaris]